MKDLASLSQPLPTNRLPGPIVSFFLSNLPHLLLLQSPHRPLLVIRVTIQIYGPLRDDVPIRHIVVDALEIGNSPRELVDEGAVLGCVPDHAPAALRLGMLRQSRRRLEVFETVGALEVHVRAFVNVRSEVTCYSLWGLEQLSVAVPRHRVSGSPVIASNRLQGW